MTTYLGGEIVAGGKMKSVGTTYWNSPNTGATNESGFSALPGGSRHIDGSFQHVRNYAFFWSTTENGPNAWDRYLGLNGGGVDRVGGLIGSNGTKSVGASVRCIKD